MTERTRRRPSLLRAAAGALGALALLAGCSSAHPTSNATRAQSHGTPAPSSSAQFVPPGPGLQAAVDACPPGGELRLAPGVHTGPVSILKPLILTGSVDAIVRSAGSGTTVRVESDRVTLRGFSIEGSGTRFDLLDAAVFVRGNDVTVEGLRIAHALFGIAVERSYRVHVLRNDITGTDEPELGLRGDAVRFWETRDSEIAGNHVRHSRDMVVWYSPNNRVLDNTAEEGRYGTHFMYSPDNVARGNRYVGNLVGIFVMYCRNVTLEDNLMARSDPTGGMGLGVKESGNLRVVGNRFVRDQNGIYLDTSPLQRGDRNTFERNTFAFCEAGVAFHSSETRNAFTDNTFEENRTDVRVEGGGDATRVEWARNFFDDYRGYDMDGDGTGDIPHELRSFSTETVGAHPELAFFSGTPAMGLLDALSQIFPLLAPKALLVDRAPRMSAPQVTEVARAR